MPKPALFPKRSAIPRPTMKPAMMFAIGRKNRITHHIGLPLIFTSVMRL